MYIDFFLERFRAAPDKEAIIWRDKIYTYGDILSYVENDIAYLKENNISERVVSLETDFSPYAIALLLALIELGSIVVPLTASVKRNKDEYKEIAEVEEEITFAENGKFTVKSTGRIAAHELFAKLKNIRHPGLVIFTSGSTGKSKAAVHDFLPLIEKFKKELAPARMIAFLLFDHISGINTALYAFSGICLVTLKERRAEAVCEAVEKHKVDILPVSPSFLNLILFSEAYKRFDMSSLKLVTYGTEPMPESTLQRFRKIFPQVKLKQMYGLSEIGIMRSKSKSSDSLWVKIGGEDFKTRVVDGLLEIKAKSAMLGYLNAKSPFTEDGWFKTGDEVLVDGEYIKILGRKSEMINVGGQKLFPAEVESVLSEMEGVEDVAIVSEPNVVTGQIVVAKVKLKGDETEAEFKKRMRLFCKGKLEPYKVPQKIIKLTHSTCGERFKKIRK